MKIVPSLSFQGQCREAFEFYASILGGTITAAFPYGEGPPDMPVGPQYRDWLMHCWMDVGDQSIMSADMDTDWAPNIDKPKNGFDICITADDVDSGGRWFEALADGGKVVMPFDKTFWSPGYGACIDKFGIPWMVNTRGTDEASDQN